MAKTIPNKKTITQINKAVECYKNDMLYYDGLCTNVIKHFTTHETFSKLIHSSKYRTKDPKHLHDKLIRKAIDANQKGGIFDISEKNIFTKIDDLAGIRFLHIHTKQIESIHPLILEILEVHNFQLIGTPIAFTWDNENQALFEKVGFDTRFRESMYTSVHYIAKAPNSSRRCEIQVRTLMEELWGEVSHKINYPDETESVPCQEQLRALARIASGCTRLVDSIFTSYEHHKDKSE
ncbi:MAG: RelA/SpoT domain-containing protein [Planctomycetes bacterium]|nr:RelA/SpoT domain-containing protein [Planctomycetota bacterium]